ncbi:MAG: hypothetical protein C5B51_13905 [Terriglobia bacterium]|nr:MAG: hypothetical protein C5B51_13905 [Terriglobia bacterium]
MSATAAAEYRQARLLRLAAITGERRAKGRYPVTLDVRYTVSRGPCIVETGVGRSVNLSSGGMFFEAAHALSVGQNIELSMTWPALLHGVTALRLHATGRIVRVQGRYAAVQIESHQFRTRGRID